MLDKEKLKKEIIKELNKPVTIMVEVIDKGVELPSYKNIGDAGMDVRASKDIEIHPEETKIIPTGLKMAIPEGYEIQVRPRSGLSLKTPLRVSNSPGTIDSGYRDEIGIIITNTSSKQNNNIYTLEEKENKMGIYQIKKGDRIAQLVLNKIEKIEFKVVENTNIETYGTNRGGGFGSTGTK